MNKFFVSTVFTAVVLASAAYADNDDAFIIQTGNSNYGITNQHGTSETAGTGQTGSSNSATISQGYDTGAYDPTTANGSAYIVQNGNSNNAASSQIGNGNYSIVSQTGNSNEASLVQNDNYSQAYIQQSGNSNTAGISQGIARSIR